MRKLFLFLSFLTLVIPTFAQTTGSSPERMIAPDMPIRDPSYPFPVPQPNGGGLPGQDQYYSIQLRGNGEALVSLKVIFTNETQMPLNSLTLQGLTGVNPDNITAYQVTAQQQCMRWIYPTGIPQPLEKIMPLPTLSPNSGFNSSSGSSGSGVASPDMMPMRQYCGEYGPADISAYMSGNARYQKISADTNGETLTFNLNEPIAVGKTGAVIATYRTSAYIKKSVFGAYDYSFITLKTDSVIRMAQIGVNVDPDLKLRGVKSGINYGQSIAAPAIRGAELDRVNVSSPEFDSFYNQIGSGMILKQASQLQPGETYSLSGTYAASTLQLYAREIFMWVVILVALILLCMLIVRSIIKRTRQRQTELSDVPRPQGARGSVFMQAPSWVFALCGGLGSAFILLLYSLFVIFVMSMMQNFYSPYAMIIPLLLAVLSIGVYGFVLLVPAGVLWWKRGWKYGVLTLGIAIACLFVFLMISVVIIIAMGNQPNIMPMMKY